MFNQKKINEATDAELFTFATAALNLDGVDPKAARAELIAKIETAWVNDYILIPVEIAAPVQQTFGVAPEAEMVIEDERYGPTTYFKILPTDMPGGKDPAHPTVNEKKIVIQRNRLVGVPYAFYEALKNAVIGAPYEVEGGPGKPPIVLFSNVTNYPLSEVTLPSAEALAAHRARWGKRELGDTTPMPDAAEPMAA